MEDVQEKLKMAQAFYEAAGGLPPVPGFEADALWYWREACRLWREKALLEESRRRLALEQASRLLSQLDVPFTGSKATKSVGQKLDERAEQSRLHRAEQDEHRRTQEVVDAQGYEAGAWYGPELVAAIKRKGDYWCWETWPRPYTAGTSVSLKEAVSDVECQLLGSLQLKSRSLAGILRWVHRMPVEPEESPGDGHGSVLERLDEWISQARDMNDQSLRDAEVEGAKWDWFARQIEEAKEAISGKTSDPDDTGSAEPRR